MYVAIRHYQAVDPGSVDELLQKANEGLVPIIKEAPGFQAYYALNSGGGTVTTVSVFEDQTGAEESNRFAADWVGENIAAMVQGPPEITEGEVRAHAAAPTGPVGAVTGTVGGATSTVTDTAGGLLGGGSKGEQDKG
ncbi:MAG: antibiotic biosynthesis monooxygenase [Rubrobacteraceae bacterium]